MKIKKLDHLSRIYNEYDAFLIDLWGVMHNGIKLNSSAINTVKELEANGKRVVFLSYNLTSNHAKKYFLINERLQYQR
mgnify:CR=1 FL=1